MDQPLGVVGVGGGQREAQLAVREHVRAVGERDGALGALLDEQDRDPLRRGSAASASKTTFVTVGDSPSDGSSSRSTSGRATSARAIASCCCWPPESAPACRAWNSRTIGKRSSTRSTSSRCTVLRAARGEPEPEVLLDGELAEDAPPLRHERDAAARDVLGRPCRARSVPADRARRRRRRGPGP